MNLTFDDHRIDDVAAVINGDEPTYLDLARTFVDVDVADIAAEGICKIRRIIIIDCFESRFHSWRMIRVSGKRDLLNCLSSFRRTLNKELSGFPFKIFLVRLEQVCGNLARLVL